MEGGEIWIKLRLIPSRSLERSELESKLKTVLPELRIRSCQLQPIAFGIDSWILELIFPEQEGILDYIESKLQHQEWISSWEIMGSGRMIKIK